MALFAPYDKSTTPWKRRTGIYGHLPKFTMHSWHYYGEHTPMFCRIREGCPECAKVEHIRYWRPRQTLCGYLSLITKKHYYTFFYQGNPGYRGRKWQVFEKDGTPYPFPSRRIR
jgi:hypothetical protein